MVSHQVEMCRSKDRPGRAVPQDLCLRACERHPCENRPIFPLPNLPISGVR
jgi:hypothetical protein